MRQLFIITIIASTIIPIHQPFAEQTGHTGNCSSCHGGQEKNRYRFINEGSQIIFSINYYGYSEVFGFINHINGGFVFDEQNIDDSSVLATVDVNSINMHDDLLNVMLRSDRFFHADKFPQIEFKSTGITNNRSDTIRINGKLRIRNIEKPVALDVKINKKGKHPETDSQMIGFSASTVITRSDFGMPLGIPVISDKVNIRIEAFGTKLD